MVSWCVVDAHVLMVSSQVLMLSWCVVDGPGVNGVVVCCRWPRC